MSTRKKRLEKARKNPKNVRYDDLVTILLEHGFLFSTGNGTSHATYVYNKNGLALRMTIVYRTPHVKEVYVKEALEMIDQIREVEGE